MEFIEEEQPDVIGFQEVLPHVFGFLKKYLADYEIVGCGRNADFGGEHVPVAFRRDRFELMALDTRWLSPTPFVAGSRFPAQSPCPRTITVATLIPVSTNTPIHVVNLHLDHESESARVLGAKCACDIMKETLARRDCPIALMGDFNTIPDSDAVNVFLSEMGMIDNTNGIARSFHDYGRRDMPRIDYIMSRGFVQTEPPKAHMYLDNGIYLSDHYPLSAKLEIGETK